MHFWIEGMLFIPFRFFGRVLIGTKNIRDYHDNTFNPIFDFIMIFQ